MTEEAQYPLSPEDFARQDESDDNLFYRFPRLVVHIDDQAIAVVSDLFRDIFYPQSPLAEEGGPPQAEDGSSGLAEKPVILDLMSSWRSHWPVSHSEYPGEQPDDSRLPENGPSRLDKKMIGLGLNAVEMQENPDLDEHVIHDVNEDSSLPFNDNTFDGVVITVSIQYLTRPVEVFRDVNRVLKPGGVFLVIFSNRMFFTKAVRTWRTKDDIQRMDLVASYFQYAGDYEDVKGMCRNPHRGPFDDPVYVVMARKPL